jgi:hypothetical protein
MAAKKRKPAIEKPQGIIDDIIEVGVDVVRRSTRDMAKHHIASGRRMRKAAKDLGKSETILNNVKRRPKSVKNKDLETFEKSSKKSYLEMKDWQDNRRKMRELIADAKGTKSVPTKASEARRARETKQLKKKTGNQISPYVSRRKYYGEYNK